MASSLSEQRITIEIVCNAIDKLMDCDIEDCGTMVTRFDGNNVPSISIKSYIARFAKYSPFPSACLLTLLAYLDRIKSCRPDIAVSPFSIHRLVMCGLILSIKFHCDHIYSNRYYAKVGGVSTVELMRLEFDMLSLLNYRITVHKEELDMYKHQAFSLAFPASLMASRAPKLQFSQSTPVSPTPSRSSSPVPMIVHTPSFIENKDSRSFKENENMHTNKHMHFVSLHTPAPIRSQNQSIMTKIFINKFDVC